MIKKCVVEADRRTFTPQEASANKFYLLELPGGGFAIVKRDDSRCEEFSAYSLERLVRFGLPLEDFRRLTLPDLLELAWQRITAAYQFDTAQEMFQFLAENMKDGEKVDG